MPDQKSLRAKLGINRRRFKAKVKVEDKDDFEWKPHQQRLKKEVPKAMSKFVAWNFMQLNFSAIIAINITSVALKCVVFLKLNL